MIIKILSVQFLKFLRGLLVKSIDFVHRGFRVRVSLDVNEGQLLNELLLHGFTSFLPPIFYHGWGEGDKTNVRVTAARKRTSADEYHDEGGDRRGSDRDHGLLV